MEGLHWTLLLGILLFFKGSEGCSCIPRHSQQNYCEAHMVLNGTVMFKGSVTGDFYETVYYFKVAEVIRARDDLNNVLQQNLQYGWDIIPIYTSSPQGACGVDIPVGTSRVLLVGVYENRATIGSCDNWTLKMFDDTEKFRNYNCQCQVRTEFRENAPPKGPQECLISSNDYYCYDQHSKCVQSYGQCQWTQSSGLQNCINNKWW